MIISVIILEAAATAVYYLCSKLMWKKLYPRVIYAWGEEKERYSKLEGLRSNLFWGVLVTIIISIIVGLLLK